MANTTFTLWLPDDATSQGQTLKWRSSHRAVATVNNGVVSVQDVQNNPLWGQVPLITITAKARKKKYTWNFVVSSDCNPRVFTNPGRASFRTPRTWTVGNQEWSDVVVASNCRNRTTFDPFRGATFGERSYTSGADCRSNSTYGDFFSWCAVIQFQDQLCPEDWRVPTPEDFEALDRALGGTGMLRVDVPASFINSRYIDRWGGDFGGVVYAYGGEIGGQRGGSHIEVAGYWFSGVITSQVCLYLSLMGDRGTVAPTCSGNCAPWNGHSLRCVRTPLAGTQR
jgi:uncharacterized protein (TIGR02145 family)